MLTHSPTVTSDPCSTPCSRQEMSARIAPYRGLPSRAGPRALRTLLVSPRDGQLCVVRFHAGFLPSWSRPKSPSLTADRRDGPRGRVEVLSASACALSLTRTLLFRACVPDRPTPPASRSRFRAP